MGNQNRQRDSRLGESSLSLESGKPHSSKPRKLENEAEVSLSAEGKVEGF